jgi:hypothetical protein
MVLNKGESKMANVPLIVAVVSAHLGTSDTPTPVPLYTPKETTLFRATSYISPNTSNGNVALSWTDPTTAAVVITGLAGGPNGPPTGTTQVFLAPAATISYELAWGSVALGGDPFDVIFTLEALT